MLQRVSSAVTSAGQHKAHRQVQLQSVHSAVHSPLLQRVSDWCHFSGVDDGCQARGWLANEPHIAAAIDCSSVNKLQWVMV